MYDVDVAVGNNHRTIDALSSSSVQALRTQSAFDCHASFLVSLHVIYIGISRSAILRDQRSFTLRPYGVMEARVYKDL